MKRYVSIIYGSLITITAAIWPQLSHGQSFGNEWQEEFNRTAKSHLQEFEETARSHFEQIRSNLNADFIKTIDNAWRDYRVMAGEERPQRKEPETIPVAPELPDNKPAPDPLELIPGKINMPYVPVKPIDLTVPKNPQPLLVKEPRVMQFDFFGTKFQIKPCYYSNLDVRPDQNSIKQAWQQCSASKQTDGLIDDCIRLRESLRLPDMGYLWLLETVAEEICPGNPDSQAFLTAYLLNQSGYDTKIGFSDSALTLLFPTDVLVYATPRVEIDGKDYYIRNRKAAETYVRTFNTDFYKDGIEIRMVPDRMPEFPADQPGHVYSSGLWTSEPEFKVTVNEPLMKFMGEYPQISWEYYAQAPLTEEFRANVLPVMAERTKGAGLNEYDGVRKLLAFLHYGFDYKEDHKQYGYEKVNFPDENFYYPFNDCEDRSILFATLVREIYGLDVVLLHYPNHLSTAVNFNDPTAKGDFLTIDGKHYVVCDPTFSGAPVGMSMPQYASAKPEIYRIARR